eukprot:11212168-Lingulodinium_polyedra.AAC.1
MPHKYSSTKRARKQEGSRLNRVRSTIHKLLLKVALGVAIPDAAITEADVQEAVNHLKAIACQADASSTG